MSELFSFRHVMPGISFNLYHVCPHRRELIEAVYIAFAKKSRLAATERLVCVRVDYMSSRLVAEEKTISGNSHLTELRFC